MMRTLYRVGRSAIKLFLGRGSMRSWSQFGEDAVIKNFFRYESKGFYIDVGAYHPHLYSNTYALYRKGWRGIVIDPNPTLPALFKIFRPRDIFVSEGVGEGERMYEMHEDGAYNSFVLGTGARLIPLRDIIKEHDVSHIDFLSIDVEGMDLEVLHSHDWEIKPRVIAVESDFNAEKVVENEIFLFLRERDYMLRGVAGKTLIFALKQ